MNRRLQRRSFLTGTTLAVPALTLLKQASASPLPAFPAPADGVHDAFPTQAAELVKETVLVSHANLERLKELVDATPTLARASWDWGFGDWESALGAASHMGRRDIAEYLLEKGARPNLFSAAMLGQLPVVRAFVEASPGLQGILGPHGITLLSHAKAGGNRAAAVVEYLETVGGGRSATGRSRARRGGAQDLSRELLVWNRCCGHFVCSGGAIRHDFGSRNRNWGGPSTPLSGSAHILPLLFSSGKNPIPSCRRKGNSGRD